MYHKWQSYDVWILRYGVQQTKCFVILVHFLHFYPTNNPENEHFEKMKKTPGHIIILPMSTINDNHMTYGSWDLECDRQNFLSFWAFFALSLSWQPEKSKFYKNEKNAWKYYHFTQLYHKWKSYNVWFLRYRTRQTQFFVILDHFLPFYPTNNQKNQNKEKWKKWLQILPFYRSAPKIMISTVPEIWHMTDVIFIFHFGLFFALLHLNGLKNQILKKYHHHLTCVPKIMITWHMVPEIWCKMDGWTDRKSDI